MVLKVSVIVWKPSDKYNISSLRAYAHSEFVKNYTGPIRCESFFDIVRAVHETRDTGSSSMCVCAIRAVMGKNAMVETLKQDYLTGTLEFAVELAMSFLETRCATYKWFLHGNGAKADVCANHQFLPCSRI